MIKLNLNLLLLLLLTIFTISTSSSYSESEKFYNELVKDWPKIFPDSNRNAAGPKFYNHILKKYTNYKEVNVKITKLVEKIWVLTIERKKHIIYYESNLVNTIVE